jgi:hypothetical protein
MQVDFEQAIEKCAAIEITPAAPSVEINASQDFTAKGRDPSDTSFNWSADGGQIDATTGHFTAPDKPGTVTVTATSAQHPNRSGSARVAIVCPPDKSEVDGECKVVGITIDPTTATLDTGATKQFTATVTGTADTRVHWTTNGGSTTPAGFYTAPQTPGTYTLTAQSEAAPAKTATAQITVGHGTVQVTSRSEDPGALSNATVYWSDPNSPVTLTDTDPDNYGNPGPFTGPLLGSTSGSFISGVTLAKPDPPPPEGPEVQASAAATLSASTSVSVSNGHLDASADASEFHLTAHGEQRTFQGLADVHVNGVNMLRLTFTVTGGSVHILCAANFSLPPTSVNGVQYLDSTSVQVGRTGHPADISLTSASNSLFQEATLVPGTYNLVIYAGGAGRVYTLQATMPLDLDWTGEAGAACNTS